LSFKLCKRSALVGSWGIALHDAFEAEPSNCRDQVQRTGEHHPADRTAE
jgi:hypothetical protein